MEIKNIGLYISLGCCALLFLLASMLWYMYEAKIEQIAQLEARIQVLNESNSNLSEALEKQNKALKELSIKANVVDTSKILEIEVRDESCEAELHAYKELFKELGNEK
ncbi:hypothetical protein [Helicobacter sp. MIT 05-5294]|uniref:hypothetical protein n=1 Tax=Helicobacter sp. MIT 05-5294 TaxID=1548150 RepID=UPI00051FC164|nr:hypothetical protein [Helicobacter sp. MIT 05-5294]TLD85821.1 hypothetical protein LS69_007955 [Helicobacter sp. MIT 05-5294]